jgi:REP element-mobilizing transposase RayT
MYPAVRLSGVQAREVGTAFAEFAKRSGLTLWACSILPEHIHLVVARHRYKIEQVVNLLKGAATTRLLDLDMHPLAAHAREGKRPPPMWARGEWKVYLDSETDIRRAIEYVEQNPVKEGKPPQHWRCVTPFQGILD